MPWSTPARTSSDPDDTPAQAQRAKLDHGCRKLLLRPGERLLDIGCGWGALVIHAETHYGVRAHGITLSKQQLTLARESIAAAGVSDQVSVELRDYRDLMEEDSYDKVSSFDMFEHIGLKNPSRVLRQGAQVAQAGRPVPEPRHHARRGRLGEDAVVRIINRYVFPDGQLDTVSNIQPVMERAHFEIADVESLRPHYALTLRHWVARLEQHHDEVLQFVSESTWCVWRLYMAACALEFESGEIGVYQVLASKRDGHGVALPLTRRHLYSDSGSTHHDDPYPIATKSRARPPT